MMTYEQRVEVYGDVCLKFTTLFERDAAKLEQVVASVLAADVPTSEEPVRYYLQQIYVQYKPTKGSWLFKKASTSKKRQQPIAVRKGKSRKMNAWIADFEQLKVPERAAIFATYYLQLAAGAVSELMQTPIDTVRGNVKSGAVKLERILEKYNVSYINETNFKKYFDEDFGSTYNARRRLKQVHVVAELQQAKQKKPRRPVPNWVPIVVAFFVCFSSLATPFAYHQSKKMYFMEAPFIEIGIMLNSFGQPYYSTMLDNYKMTIDYLAHTSASYEFLKEQGVDLADINDDIERYYNDWISMEEDLPTEYVQSRNKVLAAFNVSPQEYYLNESTQSVIYTTIYEKLTPQQVSEQHQFQEDYIVEKRPQIEAMYERYKKYGASEKFKSCTPVTYTFEVPNNDLSGSTLFCIMPDGSVAYEYLNNTYEYFHELILQHEEHLGVSYIPFNYHLFYDYLSALESPTQKDLELLQFTQILAYTYELIYPGWIETVPLLKAEDLIFSN